MAVQELFVTSSESSVYLKNDLLTDKFMIRLTCVLALLAGPVVFVICSQVVPHLVQNDRFWVLVAFVAMGFESVWLLYGLGALIHRAIEGKTS